MSKIIFKINIGVVMAVVGTAMIYCGIAQGAAVSWNGSVSGTQNWNNTANWGTGTGPVPGLVAANADTVTIGGGATFNSITIQLLDTSSALFSPDITKLTITARTSSFSNRVVTINQGTGGGTLSLGSGGFQGNDGDSLNAVTVAAPIVMTANQNWNWNNGNANHNINSNISGNFTLTHTGGYLRFNQQSTFTGFTLNGGSTALNASSTAGTGAVTSGPLGTGTVTLSSGVLESNDANGRTIHNSISLNGNITIGATATQTGAITLTPSTAGTSAIITGTAATRTLTTNVTTTINHAIGDGGAGNGLAKSGTGSLTLGGANTYSGVTNINAGSLILSANGSIANSSAITINSGATFNISAVSGGFALGASQTLTGGRVSTPATDITGTLASAGTINVGATGTAATLTIAGGLTLTGGTLRFDVSNNISSGNDLIVITGALNLSNTTSIQINLLNPIATGMYTLIIGGTSVTGGTANLTLTGLPTTTRQTFALDTTTSPGSVLLVVSGAPGTIVWSGPGAWDLNTTPNWDAGANTFFNLDNVTFNDTSANGAVALNFSAFLGGVTCNNSTTNYTLSGTGAITGVGVALTKSGTGSLTLSTANTYTGTTSVSGGTLVAGINNAFGSGPMTVSGSGSVLDLAGFTASMGTVTLNSAGSLNGSGSTLTSTGTFELQDGTVNLILGGTGALNKTTSGTVTLNAANTATGLTTVSDGTLAYGITNALATGAVTVNGAAAVLSLGAFNDTVGIVTVAGGGSITGTGTLTSTGTFEMQVGSVAAKLGGTGIVLNKTTTGTVTLSGANTYTGATNINAGILNAQSATALGTTAGGATVSTGATLQLQGGIAIGAETLTLSGTGAAGQNGGLVNVSGTNTYGGNISLQAHSAISSDGGSLTLSNGITGTNFNVTLTGSGNGFVGTGITTGSGTLVKNGTGTWQLNNNASTYTGLTTINAGVLSIRNNASLGTTAAGTVVNSGGTLQLQNNLTAVAEALNLNGSGASGQTGALTNLSGTNTLSGLITLGASATIASDTGTMTISNPGTITGSGFDLTLGGASNGSLASIIGTGAGGLIKTGSGSWTLTGANTYSGATAVNAGTLVLASGGSISASATSVAGGMLRGTGTAGAITVTSGMVFPGTANYTDTIPAFATNQVLNVAGTVSVNFSNGKLGVLLVPGTTSAGGAVSQLSVPAGTVILGTNSILSVGAQADTGFTYGTSGTKYVIISQNTNTITNSFKQVIGLPSQFSVNYFSGGPTGTPVSDGGTAGGTLSSPADTVVITYNGGTVTPVKIADFAAKSEGAGVNVSWTCVSEYQNAGFNIYRRALESAEWTKVNPTLIAGRITNPDERKYAYFDFAPAGMYEYKLESINLSGGREFYSKLSEVVDVDWLTPAADVSTMVVESAMRSIDMEISAQTAQRIETLFAAARVSEPVVQASSLPVSSQPQVDTKVAVREIAARSTANVSSASNIQAQSPAVGIRWFSSGRIGTSSNYTTAKVTYKNAGVMLIPQSSMPNGFDLNNVSLQREGRNLNALAKVVGGLLVYAPGYKDNYTDKDSIFIRKTTSATNAGTPTSATGLFSSVMPVNVTSSNSVTNEYHDVYFDYSLRPYSFEPWFSSKYLTQGSSQDFNVNLTDVVSGSATLVVNLWSLTSSDAINPDHGIQVLVNGQAIGETSWDGGNKMLQLSFTVPAGNLKTGNNIVSLVTPTIDGLDSQISFLHSISVNYTRGLDGSKPFEIANTSSAAGLYELYNVPATGAWVVDARFSDRASLVPTESLLQADGTLRVRFIAQASGSGKYLVVPNGQENKPLSVNARQVKALKLNGTYLATGPAQFASGVQPLLMKRSKEGIRGTFVDQEQLFDYYNCGRFGPDGIRNAVRSTKPTYLLLVGRTTYDYLNYEGQNIDPLCPAYLVSTSFWAQTTSDSAFGDLGRGYPEVAVGRLPVNNTTELAGAVSHIVNYKGIPQSGIRLHAMADRPDPLVADFGAQLDAAIKVKNPDITWQENYLARTYQTAPEVTAALKDAANGGADFIVYSGHGNAARLGAADPRILDQTSVQSWTGNTVFLQSTCTANWMAKNVQDYKSIAIQALTQSQGGISASVGTSTYMTSDVATAFMNQLLKNANWANARWGSVLMKTQQWAGSQPGSAFYKDLMTTEQLFGDPAMPVFTPKSSVMPPSASSNAAGTF